MFRLGLVRSSRLIGNSNARTTPVFTSNGPSRRLNSNFPSGPLLRCPKCGTKLPTPLPACTNCDFIQKLDRNIPYHDLLQLPMKPNPFVVDSGQLKQHYLQAQKICHPDAWSSHGEEYKKIAETLSNYVGLAWNALKDPLARAEYILKLHDVEIAEEDQLEDLELISEIMEIREALEDASPSQVEIIVNNNRERMRQTCMEIEQLIGEGDWEATRIATIRLKYLDGIQRAGTEWRPNSF